MTTKNTYGLKVAVSFTLLILFLIIGSFVVSMKYSDLAYLFAFAIFCFKFIRLG